MGNLGPQKIFYKTDWHITELKITKDLLNCLKHMYCGWSDQQCFWGQILSVSLAQRLQPADAPAAPPAPPATQSKPSEKLTKAMGSTTKVN